MVTEKSFAAGAAYPSLAPGKLRLYSMRFCPFAQRTRLVLAAKKIPCETVNVNLQKKPEWFLERNPLGTVPVLEQDGKVVFESAITCEFLDQAFPGPRLAPTDPYLQARDKMLTDTFSSVTTPFYKILRGKGQDKDDIAAMIKALERYEKALKERGNFFGGAAPSMVDFLMWPWFERLPILVAMAPGLDLKTANLPGLADWVDRMRQNDVVKATAFDTPTHLAFFKSFGEGNPNYDLGL